MVEVKIDKIKLTPIKDLKLNKKNRNKHPQEQIDQLAKVIKYQGFRQPLVVSTRTGTLVAGHGRLEVAKMLGMEKVPVSFQDFADEAQEWAYGISDNAIQQQSILDFQGINMDLPDFGPDFDLDLLGIKDFKLDVAENDPAGSPDAARAKLSDKFMLPPFSVLNAREGWWQERKGYWIALGIKSELGRGGGEQVASFKNQGRLDAFRLTKT